MQKLSLEEKIQIHIQQAKNFDEARIEARNKRKDDPENEVHLSDELISEIFMEEELVNVVILILEKFLPNEN